LQVAPSQELSGLVPLILQTTGSVQGLPSLLLALIAKTLSLKLPRLLAQISQNTQLFRS